MRTLTFGAMVRDFAGRPNGFANAFVIITDRKPDRPIYDMCRELEGATGHEWKIKVIQHFDYKDTPEHRDLFNKLVATIEARNVNKEVELIRVE
ncbi:hypothetical protein [Aeromonas dhakensis]|uniref:hypothetical protein n=1 Tax=Aeromonas dhakensis TaxID=196024 RepID=UPI0038CFEB81